MFISNVLPVIVMYLFITMIIGFRFILPLFDDAGGDIRKLVFRFGHTPKQRGAILTLMIVLWPIETVGILGFGCYMAFTGMRDTLRELRKSLH